FAEGEGEDISLYSSENDVQLKKPEYEIPDESEAILLQNISTFEYNDQLYLYIQYEEHDIESKEEQTIEGYVKAEQVVLVDDVEEFLETRQQKEDEKTNTENDNTETPADSKDNEIENENDKDKDDENAQSVENPDKKEKEDS